MGKIKIKLLTGTKAEATGREGWRHGPRRWGIVGKSENYELKMEAVERAVAKS